MINYNDVVEFESQEEHGENTFSKDSSKQKGGTPELDV